MSKSRGKDLLRTCLMKFDKTARLESYVCCKRGTKNCMNDYQNDNADAVLTENDFKCIQAGATVVVKCFVKSEMYAGWHASAGIGNGKYQVDISILKDFEANTEQDYKVITTGSKDDEKVYLFRKESGAEKFFENVLGLKRPEENQ